VNTAMGYLDRLRNSSAIPAAKVAKPDKIPPSGVPVVGAYYTNVGAGVAPEKEYSQLVDGYKSWVYTSLDYAETVLLSGGKRKTVKQIVDEKYSGKVISFNEKSLAFEEKRVTDWHKNPLGDRKWMELSYESVRLQPYPYSRKSILITDDHEIITKNRGRVAVKYLTKSDWIATRFRIPNPDQMKIVVGTLLGDGSVTRRLGFTHTESQSEWLGLKASALRGLGFYTAFRRAYGATKKGRYARSADSPFWRQLRRR